MAGPLFDEEGVPTAKADLGEAMVSKTIADHAGDYTRGDVFDVRVNAALRRVTQFDEEGVAGCAKASRVGRYRPRRIWGRLSPMPGFQETRLDVRRSCPSRGISARV